MPRFSGTTYECREHTCHHEVNNQKCNGGIKLGAGLPANTLFNPPSKLGSYEEGHIRNAAAECSEQKGLPGGQIGRPPRLLYWSSLIIRLSPPVERARIAVSRADCLRC